MSETPKQRVWGRWVVLAAVVLGAVLFYGLGIKAVMPSVVLPPEPLTTRSRIVAMSFCEPRS